MTSTIKKAVAAVAIATTMGIGHTRAAEHRIANTMIRFDVDSTTPRACRMEGVGGSVFLGTQDRIPGMGRIKSAADPSANVTSNTAASGALGAVSVQDILFVKKPAALAPEFAVVLTKADADTITVDPTVSWSTGFNYSFLKTVCGTTSADGWIDVSGADEIVFTLQFSQGDLDALSVQFQCKSANIDAEPVVVYPSEGDGCGNAGTQVAGFCDFTPAPMTFSFEEFGVWSSCRIWFKDKSTDASDAGANLERVTGSIAAQMWR